MIVADTGAIVALVDADDRHHTAMRELYESNARSWVVPWAVLPEADYMILNHVGPDSELDFVRDVADGRFEVEWGGETDLARARELCDQYRDLRIGLVDAVVMAISERVRTHIIATLDLRHFGAVDIKGQPRLFPRDK